MHEIQKTYHVVDRKNESQETVTLFLALANGSVPAYNPGQFITVFFSQFNTPEGKAYSISSSPHEAWLAITVKKMGQFSDKICSLQTGDTIAGSLPYGFFGPEYENSRLIMIAGGVGITPFRSILLSTLTKNPEREISLFYTAKEKEGLVFYGELTQIVSKYKNVHMQFFVTQENIAEEESVHARRLCVADILPVVSEKTEFLICGSIDVTRHFWKALKDAGVDETTIYTEAFFR